MIHMKYQVSFDFLKQACIAVLVTSQISMYGMLLWGCEFEPLPDLIFI